MDVLVSLGSIISYAYSIISMVHRYQLYQQGIVVDGMDYFETAALLITFISLGKLLEAHAKGKTSEVSHSPKRLSAAQGYVCQSLPCLLAALDDMRSQPLWVKYDKNFMKDRLSALCWPIVQLLTSKSWFSRINWSAFLLTSIMHMQTPCTHLSWLRRVKCKAMSPLMRRLSPNC